MSTPTWKKNFILIFGLFENIIFSGTILGWSALNYMLKSEGVFQNICHDDYQVNDYNYSITQRNSVLMKNNNQKVNQFISYKTADSFSKTATNFISINSHDDTNFTSPGRLQFYMEPRFSPIDPSQDCNAQDKLLNLAFTIGSFLIGFTGFVWGFLLDKWGLRIVRLLFNSLITSGVILLCFTSKDRPYLIFPALVLLCFGSVSLRIADVQFADLYPTKRSTIISLYGGAYCASAVVFVFLKCLYDFGVSYFLVTLILLLVSLLMLPFTLFVLPSDRIQEDSRTNDNQSQPQVTLNAISSTVPPLKVSLWSWTFLLHQWWFSWLITYMIIYVGSMNLWIQRVTNDLQTTASIINIYGIVQISCLVSAPIAGYFMDYSIKTADQETDPFERKLQRVKAGFWPIFVTTLFLVACLVCNFLDNESAIYVSIAFITINRSFMMAVGNAYLRIRFHGQHFNRLLGIMTTTSSIISLIQFPLFVWQSQSPKNAFWMNIFNCSCTLITFTNPLHILITRLQRHLLLKEEKDIEKFKSR